MIKIVAYTPGKPIKADCQPADLPALLKNKKTLVWVDFESEPNEACHPILHDVFGFDDLAVEDALAQMHAPKVDDWGKYLYIVFNDMSLNRNGSLEIVTEELDAFLGANYVVTHHDQPIPSIRKSWEMSLRDPRYTNRGADHLLYKIVDNLVADYMPIVETIDEEIDAIEDQVLASPNIALQEKLFALKRALQTMRRVITPQREVLSKLARDDYEVIDPADRMLFRDVYDHLVRLHDLNESMRDLVSGIQDIYLSAINNRMNAVMKTLTIITTMFMPISFVAAFFGMNFFGLTHELDTLLASIVFYVVTALMIAVPITMFAWMRKRTWL
jgi:magnesium transporter